MATSVRWTISDLEGLPQPLDDKRYEIIEGELHVTSQPTWQHQATCRNVLRLLDAWSQQTNSGEANLAPGVVFSPEDAVAPDVVWVSRERLPLILGDDGKLHGAPDLMIEVLSPGSSNERRDRETKLRLYSLQGVREYWILDWQQRSMTVFRREQASLRLTATLYEQDQLESALLPGFSCSVAHLFGRTG